MVIDPHSISLYTIAHDWWGVAAFGFGIYKVLNYLKSFKETAEAALRGVEEVKVNMNDGRHSIRAELKTQTDAVVGALNAGMTELRQMMFITHSSHQPRAVRAAKRTTVTTTKQIQVDKQPSL